MNLNKSFVAGRLTRDPELKSTKGGQSVATFGVATNMVWTDKSGAKQERAEFHNIVVWGRQAETANQFLTKGSEVLIEGRIQTREWDDKQGNKRKTTEIIAENVQFGARPSPKPAAPAVNGEQTPLIEELQIPQGEDGEIRVEDLPF